MLSLIGLSLRSCRPLLFSRTQLLPLGYLQRCSIHYHHQQSSTSSSKLRSQRPLSPHLTIYQPQLTWLMSIGHRMTGAALATAVYGFGIYYAAVSPSNVVVQIEGLVDQIPGFITTMSKLTLAWPLFYHMLNGIRHLTWDCGWALSVRACYVTGWMVNVGSTLLAALVTFI